MRETTVVYQRGDGRRRILVLIIEDSPLMLTLLKQICRRSGRNFICASTVSGGRKMARALRPDLILMDVIPMEDSGFAAVRELARDAKTADIPVVAISSRPYHAMRERALQSGFREVVETGDIAASLMGVMEECIG